MLTLPRPLKAERLRIAQEKLEIEKLEKRKRNLLIVVTALEKANMNFQQGDPNGFTNASQSMQGFLSGLPKFSEGTIGTIADALGRTNTTDGHVVRVDDREHILSIRDSERLHRAGLRTNADIVGAAMNSQNKALSSKIGKAQKEDQTIKRLEKIEKAILNQKAC